MKNLVSKQLTEMQKEFARLHVENSFGKGALSNTEAAIKAGYAPESSYQRAYELLNPKLCPHVVKYISDLKDDFRRKNNIDPDKHMGRLHHLGLKAEENKMYGIAGQMEIARGKVAGYYVEKKMTLHKNVEELTEEEAADRMKNILKDYKHILEDKNDKKRNGKDDK
jgi:phage terminase small subunit